MGSRIWLSTGTDSVLRQDRVILNDLEQRNGCYFALLFHRIR